MLDDVILIQNLCINYLVVPGKIHDAICVSVHRPQNRRHDWLWVLDVEKSELVTMIKKDIMPNGSTLGVGVLDVVHASLAAWQSLGHRPIRVGQPLQTALELRDRVFELPLQPRAIDNPQPR